MNKRFHKLPASFHPTVVLRTHLFPYAQVYEINELLEEFSNTIFREALELASPSLVEEIDRFLTSNTFDQAKLDKFKHHLHKYWIRAHSRTTPFGLFASCSTLKWTSESTRIVFKKSTMSDRSTRIDMETLCQILDKLALSPILRSGLIYYPNDSIYCKNDRLNYVKYDHNSAKRVYKVNSLHQDEYLKEAIAISRKGATIQEIAMSIVKLDDEVDFEEALSFTNELIDEQILKSKIEPGITSGDPLEYTISLLNKQRLMSSNILEGHNELIELDKIIKDIDKSPYSSGLRKRALETVQKTGIHYLPKNIFSVTGKKRNLIKPRLNNRIQSRLISVAELLVEINPSRNNHIEKFIKVFRERYEARQVPLLEVLDPEIGIGYPIDRKPDNVSTFTENIVRTESISADSRQKISYNQWDLVLHRILSINQNNRGATINLEDYIDETQLRKRDVKIPNSLSIRFSLVGDVNKKNSIIIKPTGFSSAVNLLGRFAESNKNISGLLQDISQFESKCAEPAVLAEIVHLPQEREGNISIHPPFRRFEIPYLSNSSAPEDFQIRADDLYVSIIGNRVVLTSKRLEKEVIPTLSSAHNFTHNTLPVYRFLSSLHSQNKKFNISFNWGPWENFFTYFPRVCYKHTILHVAKWSISVKDYEEIISSPLEEQALNLYKWRQKLDIPKNIAIVRNDAELPFNLENPLDVETFISFLKKRRPVVIHEFLFDESIPQVTDEDGAAYCNEFIASLLIDNSGSSQKYLFNPKIKEVNLNRVFSLGSEWLYYKIYSTVNTSENIIVNTLESLTTELLYSELITEWFFIRYNTPSNHIRLRFHLSNPTCISRVIQLVKYHFDQSLDTGTVEKIQTDTYIREIERYGENTIHLCERWFYLDSKYTLLLLKAVNQIDENNTSWRLLLTSVDKILAYFGFSLNEKLKFSEKRKKSYQLEFKTSKATSRSINLKYREHREAIKKAISLEFTTAVDQNKKLQKILARRTQESSDIFIKLENIYIEGKSQVSKEQLVSSFVHMHINRYAKENQRFQELMCYTMLEKYYRNTIATNKIYCDDE